MKTFWRKSHTAFTPHSAEHLTERAAAIHAWEALTDELLDLGYLTNEACFECGGAFTGNTSTGTYETVWDETEEEYAERRVQMPATVTIPIAKHDADVAALIQRITARAIS